MATYSYIDSDGGLHAGHSKTIKRSISCSNMAFDRNEISIKPATSSAVRIWACSLGNWWNHAEKLWLKHPVLLSFKLLFVENLMEIEWKFALIHQKRRETQNHQSKRNLWDGDDRAWVYIISDIPWYAAERVCYRNKYDARACHTKQSMIVQCIKGDVCAGEIHCHNKYEIWD